MCTLSFLPTKDGYYAAMNRDERLTRGTALFPSTFGTRNLLAAYPFEESGGTWIACNQHGLTLALLNWNLPASGRLDKQRSRGTLIPTLIGELNPDQITRALGQPAVDGLLPFRLIGIFQGHQQIFEWRWDGISLVVVSFPWKPRHWFSSGASDEMAERIRGETCRVAWLEPDAGSLVWLRALHSSHGAVPGPFSVCAHRPDAGTVSYSEIVIDTDHASFRYVDGPPCVVSASASTLTLPKAAQRVVG